MSISKKIQRFLTRHKTPYEVLTHGETFTSCETAEAEHLSGHQLAKVVMVKVDGKDVMVVVPASHTVDLLKMKALLEARELRIEEEKEFEELFPDCEVGAMPPFGRLYKLSCFVDQSLARAREIFFNAGSHRECVRISADHFFRLVHGRVGDFSVPGQKLVAY